MGTRRPSNPSTAPRTRLYVNAVLLSFAIFIAVGFVTLSYPFTRTSAQGPVFNVGEKLSYNVSLGKFNNAAYAELFVVSRGKLSGRDAIQIQSRLKTLEMVSAAFFLFDETRVVYADPDTALPLYISTNSHNTPLPKEVINNYLTQPTTNFDLVTLMYKARESAGAGTFPLFEGDRVSTVTFTPGSQERVKTDAGEFDTVVSTVQSEFLLAAGFKDLKINFSTDDAHVPVMIRFKSRVGEFRAQLAAMTIVEQPSPSPTPVVMVTPTPVAVMTPKPSPTPLPYVNDQPLLPELGFQLGEVLDYRISAAEKPLADLQLNVQERRLYKERDSLLLTATITGVQPGVTDFVPGNQARVQVDPDTLAPRWSMTNFVSNFTGLKQTLTFDAKTGQVTFGKDKPVDAPIGTHTLLSLVYAMRSFNLKPSRDMGNPVNDTRVAVFWDAKPYVFTLRPSKPGDIMINGETRSAQLVTVNTGDAKLDALGIKVWLSMEDRVPLRFVAGNYQADLIARRISAIK